MPGPPVAMAALRLRRPRKGRLSAEVSRHGEPFLNLSQGDSYCDCPSQALPSPLAGARGHSSASGPKVRPRHVSFWPIPRGALLALLGFRE